MVNDACNMIENWESLRERMRQVKKNAWSFFKEDQEEDSDSEDDDEEEEDWESGDVEEEEEWETETSHSHNHMEKMKKDRKEEPIDKDELKQAWLCVQAMQMRDMIEDVNRDDWISTGARKDMFRDIEDELAQWGWDGATTVTTYGAAIFAAIATLAF